MVNSAIGTWAIRPWPGGCVWLLTVFCHWPLLKEVPSHLCHTDIHLLFCYTLMWCQSDIMPSDMMSVRHGASPTWRQSDILSVRHDPGPTWCQSDIMPSDMVPVRHGASPTVFLFDMSPFRHFLVPPFRQSQQFILGAYMRSNTSLWRQTSRSPSNPSVVLPRLCV